MRSYYTATGIGPHESYSSTFARCAILVPMKKPARFTVSTALTEILKRTKQIMAQLDTLTAEVTRNTTVVKSALTLIQGLKKQLDDAGTDPAKLKALSDSLAANDDELAAAVAANTPATPPTP